MISTRMHGVLDYVLVAGLVALPRLAGWDGGAKQVLTANAAGSRLLASSVASPFASRLAAPPGLIPQPSRMSNMTGPAILSRHFREERRTNKPFFR